MSATAATIWHDVECGAYAADLPLWEELAERGGGPVLDLGCGTGRVALHLARRGHEVIGLDLDPELLAALRRARATGLPLRALDGRRPRLRARSARSRSSSRRCSCCSCSPTPASGPRACAASPPHLRPGGLRRRWRSSRRCREPDGAPPPLPDVREVDGWVYSSLPVEAAVDAGDEIVIRRLRQTVSPDGDAERGAERGPDRAPSPPPQLEAEARRGRPASRPDAARSPPPTSTSAPLVVVLEKEA